MATLIGFALLLLCPASGLAVGQNNTPATMMTCPGGAILTTECMTEAQYDELVAAVRGHLESLPETCTASDCPQADWAGCVLRMAGHDFMDYANGQGGSDACTDMSDPDNAGLSACLASGEHGISLAQVYQQFCTSVSLADFLVIAAEAVMMSTRARHQAAVSAPSLDLKSSFRYGRTTAQTCGFAAGRLPNPERGCDAVQETFLDGMGLDWTEAAALMAVHTLGRAQVSNSGYHGWWSDPENSRRFNNDYFVSLLAKGWVPERSISGNTAKNQWERSDIGRDTTFDGHEMMLNTDMCLVYRENGPNGGPVLADQHTCCAWLASPEIRGAVASNGGEYCGGAPGPDPRQERQKCCGPQQGDCGDERNPTGPAQQAVRDFATDEAVWLEAFVRAWTKAVENGHTGLKSLGQCPTTSTTSSMPSSSSSSSSSSSPGPSSTSSAGASSSTEAASSPSSTSDPGSSSTSDSTSGPGSSSTSGPESSSTSGPGSSSTSDPGSSSTSGPESSSTSGQGSSSTSDSTSGPGSSSTSGPGSSSPSSTSNSETQTPDLTSSSGCASWDFAGPRLILICSLGMLRRLL